MFKMQLNTISTKFFFDMFLLFHALKSFYSKYKKKVKSFYKIIYTNMKNTIIIYVFFLNL